jgi:cadmium resistance protein CadD (predicted permease)
MLGKGEGETIDGGVGVLTVATVTFAAGGDNIAVYVPVFAVVGLGTTTSYVAIFLVGVAIWCATGWYIASRPAVATALARWGHILIPVVLIAIGLSILIGGGVLAWS